MIHHDNATSNRVCIDYRVRSRADAVAEDQYWIGGIDDQHLSAWLGVTVEPLAHALKRYTVVTIVRHNTWQGPVYFNVIRPFHHLVVGTMVKQAARPTRSSAEHQEPL